MPLYDIPALKIDKHIVQQSPIWVSALRSLGAYTKVFSIESFMDELASGAQIDPFEFRLLHLFDEPWPGVAEAAQGHRSGKCGLAGMAQQVQVLTLTPNLSNLELS